MLSVTTAKVGKLEIMVCRLSLSLINFARFDVGSSESQCTSKMSLELGTAGEFGSFVKANFVS